MIKKSMKKLDSKIRSHLKEDIEGYKKERKYLKKEIGEDKDLMKVIKNSKKSRPSKKRMPKYSKK